MASLDATFASHAALTLAHIIPAAMFVILAALLLFRRTPNDGAERLFFLLGAITGVTAYAMSSYAIGGWIERSAVLAFDTCFLSHSLALTGLAGTAMPHRSGFG
jgi:hypothetical protein